MNKVKGIALFDALVGIVLSSIVILMVFMITRSNFQTYFQMSDAQNRILEASKFKYIFKSDIFHAQSIRQKDGQLLLEGKDRIAYSFQEGYTLRYNNQLVDTLDVALTSESYQTDEELPELIRRIELELTNGKRSFLLALNKDYPSITYMRGEDEY